MRCGVEYSFLLALFFSAPWVAVYRLSGSRSPGFGQAVAGFSDIGGVTPLYVNGQARM